MNPTVLVTGGAGYIGSHACKALAEAGFTPITLDNLSAGQANRVRWGPLETGDVRDSSRVAEIFDKHQPKAVMHFAALISVGDSVTNPGAIYDVNVGGSLALLKTMKAHNVNTIVFSSTAAVYGTPESNPIKESAPTLPINPYGRSKLIVETMLTDFAQAYGFRTAALRYFNAAGATANDHLGYLRPDPTHLIPLAMQAMLGQRPCLDVYGHDYPTPDGTAVRDYIHVADLAGAHVLALRKIMEGPPNTLTLNLGTSKGHSVAEVLSTIQALTQIPVPHRIVGRRPGDPATLVADASAAMRALGWNPSRSSLPNIVADDWAWHKKLST